MRKPKRMPWYGETEEDHIGDLCSGCLFFYKGCKCTPTCPKDEAACDNRYVTKDEFNEAMRTNKCNHYASARRTA